MDILWSNKSEKCYEFYSLIKHISLFKALGSPTVNDLSNLLIQYFPNLFGHRTLLNPGWHPTETVLCGRPLGNYWLPGRAFEILLAWHSHILQVLGLSTFLLLFFGSLHRRQSFCWNLSHAWNPRFSKKPYTNLPARVNLPLSEFSNYLCNTWQP